MNAGNTFQLRRFLSSCGLVTLDILSAIINAYGFLFVLLHTKFILKIHIL